MIHRYEQSHVRSVSVEEMDGVLRSCQPLTGQMGDFDALIERIGDAQFVLIGEASHGTHEFYDIRAAITRRLVSEKQFRIVAVEGDWPDAYRVNQFVRGWGSVTGIDEAFSGFKRFPTWMWRNHEVQRFARWMRQWNTSASNERDRVGFYGLDLYSLHSSIERVVSYLDQHDPEAATRARKRYGCFEAFEPDGQSYGLGAVRDPALSCHKAVAAQLKELMGLLASSDPFAREELFSTVQNARLVQNAEVYYRSMFQDDIHSWNVRDLHMLETLLALAGGPSGRERRKVVVWAHNSHLGDARATEMGRYGQLNLGQMVRERVGEAAVLVGFSTHHGSVVAAHDWDAPPRRLRVQPALAGSFEDIFHQVGIPAFQLDVGSKDVREVLTTPRLQRAIGVVYRPQTERQSHYFKAHLPRQFDWMIHIDETRALHPLDKGVQWHGPEEEAPETYPSGL